MKREIFVGRVGIGGRHPVSIQSMTNTPAGDVGRTLAQIAALEQAGCQIVRLAVPDREALASFRSIVRRSPLPVIADIHFDASLALAALEAGSAAIRINPGNIGGARRLKEIVRLAGQRKIPIRIGVNAGSLEKKYLTAGRSRPQMMVSSALDKIRLFEDLGFHDIKVSLKSSSVKETVEAYRLMDKRCDYPLHLGLTEAGPWLSGTVKSAIAIGSLLLDGIGNTVRVSLTADPVQEVQVARQILLALGRLDRALEIISCPTCARCSVDLLARSASLKPRSPISSRNGSCAWPSWAARSTGRAKPATPTSVSLFPDPAATCSAAGKNWAG